MRGLVHVVLAMTFAPLAATLARAQDDPSVHMVTYVEVAPAAQGQAATLLRQLADASRKDAGLIRFEILQRTAPSREFVILESWKDQQAFDAHVATAHHKQFREKVAPHLIAPLDDRFSVPTLIGSPQPVRWRNSWSRSSWVCSSEVHWRPRFWKHCEGEA